MNLHTRLKRKRNTNRYFKLVTHNQWLYDQSFRSIYHYCRTDIGLPKMGEIGSVDSFRMIKS